MGVEALPIAYGFATLIGLLIFLVGYRSSNKVNKTYNGGIVVKFAPYACGEFLPQILQSMGSRINLENFFLFAIYFLVLDVAIFILIMSSNILSFEILVYTIIILASTISMVRW